MLTLEIPEQRAWNQETEEFIHLDAIELHMEYSLLAISKWESFYCMSFFDEKKTVERTNVEWAYFFKCMCDDDSIDLNYFLLLSPQHLEAIRKYIERPQTATTIKKNSKARKGKFITSEEVYSWMIGLEIPFECEKWPFSRLMALIEICGQQNAPKKKMSKQDILKQNHAINAARRAKTGSKG